jgi:hypothetical protein
MTCLDLITAIESRIDNGWWTEKSRDEDVDQVVADVSTELDTPAGQTGLRWLCRPMPLHLVLESRDLDRQPLIDAWILQVAHPDVRGALLQVLIGGTWLSSSAAAAIIAAVAPWLSARACGVMAVACRHHRPALIAACRARLASGDQDTPWEDLARLREGVVEVFWLHLASLVALEPRALRLIRQRSDLSDREIEAGAWATTLALATIDDAGYRHITSFLSALRWSRGDHDLITVCTELPTWSPLLQGDVEPVIALMGDPALESIAGDLAWTCAAVAVSIPSVRTRVRRVLWEAITTDAVARRPVVDLNAFLAAFLTVAGLERHLARDIARKSLAASPAERFLRLLTRSQETSARVLPLLTEEERDVVLELLLGAFGMHHASCAVAIGRLTAARLAG